MGVKVIPARHEYECDRCGFESGNEMARGGYARGRISYGMVSYDGATGGGSTDHWLCGHCAEALRRFMAGEAIPKVPDIQRLP